VSQNTPQLGKLAATATAAVNSDVSTGRKQLQLSQPLVITCNTGSISSVSDTSMAGLRTAAAAAIGAICTNTSASNSASNSVCASPAASPPSSQPASPR
jgi:hypothetical protein